MTTTRPKTGGRKSKLTPELLTQVETALQNHMTVNATCGMLGISRETFYKWIREGEAATRGVKTDFADAVKKAQGTSVLMLINSIGKDPSWQAKAWLLERLHPKDFGRRQLIAHAGADGESEMPTGAPAAAVNLTINMQRPDADAPWVFKEGQDQDPENGSDPWDSDHHGFNESATPADFVAAKPDPEPQEKPPAAPSRGPKLPKRDLDTGGRPRDPDDTP